MIKIFVLVLLILAFLGAEVQKQGVTQEEINNLTERINYDTMNFTLSHKANNPETGFLNRFIFKVADVYIFAMLGLSDFALNFGYANPQYDFDFAWRLFFVVCFAVLIIPTLYVLLFIGYGITALVKWIKEKRGKHKWTQ